MLSLPPSETPLRIRTEPSIYNPQAQKQFENLPDSLNFSTKEMNIVAPDFDNPKESINIASYPDEPEPPHQHHHAPYPDFGMPPLPRHNSTHQVHISNLKHPSFTKPSNFDHTQLLLKPSTGSTMMSEFQTP